MTPHLLLGRYSTRQAFHQTGQENVFGCTGHVKVLERGPTIGARNVVRVVVAMIFLEGGKGGARKRFAAARNRDGVDQEFQGDGVGQLLTQQGWIHDQRLVMIVVVEAALLVRLGSGGPF